MDVISLLDRLNDLAQKHLGETFTNSLPSQNTDSESIEKDLADFFAKVEDAEVSILGGSDQYPPNMFCLTQSRSDYEQGVWDDVISDSDKPGDYNKNFVPIAADGAGNNLMVLVDPDHSDHGKVFDWDHETREAKLVASSLRNHLEDTVSMIENGAWIGIDGYWEMNENPAVSPTEASSPLEDSSHVDDDLLVDDDSEQVQVNHTNDKKPEMPTLEDWGVVFGKLKKAAKEGLEAAKKAWEEQQAKDDKPKD